MNLKDTFIISEKSSILESTANCKDLKVVVVSIIGKSAFNTFGHKVHPLTNLFNFNKKSNKECVIECAYDDENQVIYLHLYSLLDSSNLVQQYSSLLEQCKNQNKNVDFLSMYNEVKSSYARALLFLFHVSHIVILSQPGNYFDINNVQIFKSLDNIRQKYVTQIGETLKDIPNLSSEWVGNGRPCTPRLVFYFEKCPKQFKNEHKYPQLNIKKLEHETEDRIYHILRKVRIVGSTSCNSLFAIPANQEYVYINNSSEQNHDRLAFAVGSLIKSCQPNSQEAIKFPFSSHSEINHQKRSFHKFLKVHVDLAFSKGFDDNIGTGRHCSHPTAYFEIPTLEVWLNVSNALYKYFMDIPSENAEFNLSIPSSAFSTLYIDTKFSEQRCQKVLPIALARYQENLPAHYTRTHHDDKIEMALASFATQARGPLYEKYRQELTEKCIKHFENGHQLCEHTNLTGNSKHDSDNEHCNTMKSWCSRVAICDCGRKQGSHDDHCNTKQSNYSYYQNVPVECGCSNLERMKYSVYQSSNDEHRNTNAFAGGSANTPKTVLRSQDQINSDKLTDLSQECDLDQIGQTKSEFSLIQQQANTTPQDTETTPELLEEKNNGKNKNNSNFNSLF